MSARRVVEQTYATGDNLRGALSLEVAVPVAACARLEDLVLYEHLDLAVSAVQPDSFLGHKGGYVTVGVVKLEGDILAILGSSQSFPDLENAVDPWVGFQ
jgi:hypothetical protein